MQNRLSTQLLHQISEMTDVSCQKPSIFISDNILEEQKKYTWANTLTSCNMKTHFIAIIFFSITNF